MAKELDCEVKSPVSTGATVRRGPGPGSSQSPPLSPGARSDPSARRSDQSGPSETPQPPGPPAAAHRHSEERGGTVRITEPED
jgi:hypothetical protein